MYLRGSFLTFILKLDPIKSILHQDKDICSHIQVQQGDGETVFQLRQHTAFAEVLSSTHGRWQEIQCFWPLRAHIHIPTYRHTPIHRNRKSPKGKKQTPRSHNRVVFSIFFYSLPGAGQLSLALYHNHPLQAHTLYLHSMNINKRRSWYLFWAPITDAHYTKLHCSLCSRQHRRYKDVRKHLVHFPPTIV